MSIQDELHQVEEEIARLRAEAAELRRQVGEIGPTDAAERSAMINMADEQEGLADELEGRREGLLKQAGGTAT
ncbi:MULTISPECIES: hypothetical protein [Streptosporangium]|uniref:SMC interacting uncharacterized protein involved in chromosome segregation n=1 Tax=Streptosporangium brasiliense TaxID=47480 RepID=A0ABT9R9M4_9ACTN|nr:hypothetical protein [Streptosporangium brasiliense]MDP9865950.1 SMC interacting uncharacterized protein involved in chromosome segregation [Streptosporangium brasiliense]